MTRYLEVSTAIGCTVNCLKYCPQEVTVNNYNKTGGSRLMSLELFSLALSRTPPDVVISFAGFAEPFINSDLIKMIKYALKDKHEVMLYTTLAGASKNDIEDLLALSLKDIIVHLPDGLVMKEPTTPNYRDNFFEIQTRAQNVHLASMKGLFPTNNRENLARGILPKRKGYGLCHKLRNHPFPVMLPNGYVVLCCMDFAINHVVGDFNFDDYDTIVSRIHKGEGSFALCHYCVDNQTIQRRLARRCLKTVENIVGELK